MAQPSDPFRITNKRHIMEKDGTNISGADEVNYAASQQAPIRLSAKIQLQPLQFDDVPTEFRGQRRDV